MYSDLDIGRFVAPNKLEKKLRKFLNKSKFNKNHCFFFLNQVLIHLVISSIFATGIEVFNELLMNPDILI